MKERDFEYFARRAREEELAAARATHSVAKQSHERLAQEYLKEYLKASSRSRVVFKGV
jgi:hypothetical protein